MLSSKDMDTLLLSHSSNKKYNKLIEGLKEFSAPCKTDFDLLKQWEAVDEEYSDIKTKCHCGTPITDLVKIYNSKTKLSTAVGNVCQKYFNNDEMDRLFNDRKYRRLKGHDRKKCLDCHKNLNYNTVSGYCTKCRKIYDARNSHVSFGKFKGVRLEDIPEWYLPWVIKQTWFKDYKDYVAIFLKNK